MTDAAEYVYVRYKDTVTPDTNLADLPISRSACTDNTFSSLPGSSLISCIYGGVSSVLGKVTPSCVQNNKGSIFLLGLAVGAAGAAYWAVTDPSDPLGLDQSGEEEGEGGEELEEDDNVKRQQH